MNNEWDIVPAFSYPITTTFIEEEYSNQLIKKISDFEFGDTVSTFSNSGDSFKSLISDSLNVLDEFPDLKKKLLNKVTSYVFKVLEFDANISISTSWFTKILPGGYCQYHKHSNSWLSAVYYFDEYDSNSGQLIFCNQKSFFQIQVIEDNVFNMDKLYATPKKNSLIIFPSELQHRVSKNNTNRTRYSLAFNILPLGLIGGSDNQLFL